MTPGSFEDNDRLRTEIGKLIKKDLDQTIVIMRLTAALTRVEHLCDVAAQVEVGLTTGQVRKAVAG